MRTEQLAHVHLLTYVILSCKYWQYRKVNKGTFFVMKEELRCLTGVSDVAKAVRSLYQNVEFPGGEHLFEYEDTGGRMTFTCWAQYNDPFDHPGLEKLQERWREDVMKKVSEAKAAAEERRTRKD